MIRVLLLGLILAVAAPALAARAQADRAQLDLAQADLAQAERGDQPPPSPTERLQEGAAAIVDGLRMLMDQLQSYQPPEVLPNGDIIIRRQPPAAQDPKPDEPAKPETGPRSL